MNNQTLPLTPTQSRKLSFFPASFPDETLFSRVSRYHLLTGERKEDTTFQKLFNQPAHNVDFTELAPPSLTVLATLLPGDSMVQLGKILSENTFVPFAVPVIHSSVEEFIGAECGDSNACLLCLLEDWKLVGVSYLRRSHQLPSVTACWRHGTKLIDACPECDQAFHGTGKFLKAPLTLCGCGWHVAFGRNVIQASAAEHEFAIHAHAVLEKRVHQTSLAASVRFFQSQIEHTSYKIEPTGQVNRRLLVGMIAQQMAEGRTTTEIAMAAATVMASSRKANWWVTSMSLDLLKKRSMRNQGGK